MRADLAAADRRFEVRRAATLWRRAGILDAAAESAIATLYADDRVRTTRVFRALFFGFTWFGFTSAYGMGSALVLAALGSNAGTGGYAALSVGCGVAALGVAELLHTKRRLRRFGVEEACVWIGISYAVGGGLWLFDRIADPSNAGLIGLGAWATAAIATVAAWRWATPWTGVLASIGLFVALTQVPAAHLAWLVAAGALAWPLARLSIEAHVPPEIRRRFREAFLVTSVAGYFAIHVDVVEERLFARLGPWRSGESIPPAPDWLVAASLLAMVAVPVACLAGGIAKRYRPAIDLGLLMLLASFATFAFRARPRPEWLFLVVFGGLVLGLALAVRRRLAARPGAEWRGLTARSLAEDRESAAGIEALAAVAAFAPTARTLDEQTAFQGQGGEFGGGGASAKF